MARVRALRRGGAANKSLGLEGKETSHGHRFQGVRSESWQKKPLMTRGSIRARPVGRANFSVSGRMTANTFAAPPRSRGIAK